MPPIEHAVLNASSAGRWVICPPSVRLTEGIPDTPSKYAAEGTQAHAVCEYLLRQTLPDWTKMPSPKPNTPQEMIDAAAKYLSFIYDLWVGFETAPSVFVEQWVNLTRWVPQGFGTCDCLLIGGGVLHIIDFKYGQGIPVSPDHNPQMMCYALGALELFRQTDEIDTVRMSIVQPRVQEEPETTEMPAAELLDWANTVLAPAAKLAWEGKGELTPGEHCKKYFCKAYPTCRAWQDKYGALADFESLPDPRTALSDAELGPWLSKVEGIAAYAKDLEDYATQRLVEGGEIPGWKVVEGGSKRRWKDLDAAFSAITAAGIDEAVLYTREPITLTAAEKLIGKKKFNEICGGFVEKPAGAPKLAQESDSRPALNNRLDGFEEAQP